MHVWLTSSVAHPMIASNELKNRTYEQQPITPTA